MGFEDRDFTPKSETALGVLEAAWAILFNKDRWTTGSLARDAHGHDAGYTDNNACSFCSLGAVYHVASKLNGRPRISVGHLESKAIALMNNHLQGWGTVATANDKGGYEVVKAMFLGAIREAREREL